MHFDRRIASCRQASLPHRDNEHAAFFAAGYRAHPTPSPSLLRSAQSRPCHVLGS